MIAVCAVCRYGFLVKKTMRMMKMEAQIVIQNKLAYMDSLSRANGAGHKLDKELEEIVQSLREDLDIEESAKKFAEEVKKEARVIAQGKVYEYIKKMQKEDVLTFKQAEKAREEVWNIK